MNADAQAVWIASAIEALDGISAEEVAQVSVEVRRTVTDHRHLVPAIARQVFDQRARRARLRGLPAPTKPTTEKPRYPLEPLTREELDALDEKTAKIGIGCGAIRIDNDGRYQNT